MELNEKLQFFFSGGGSPAPVWSPAQLFANSEVGMWWEPKPQYLFKDTAGTDPVTADGDLVALMVDRSGNVIHATQSSASSRLVYHTDGTRHWLTSDGVDDFFTFPTTNLEGGSLAFALEYLSTGTGSRALISSASSGYILTREDKNLYINSGSNNYQVDTPGAFPLDDRIFRINKASRILSVRDNLSATEYTNSTLGTPDGLAAASILFAFNDRGVIPAEVKFYGAIFRVTPFTSEEDQLVLDYLANLRGA